MHGRAAANDPAVLLATTEGVKEEGSGFQV
jgi:hypothetical protein